jgi:O-antigen/teichoic acid export membrane protein
MTQRRERMGGVLVVAYGSALVGQAASQAFYLLIFGVLPAFEVGIYSWAAAIAMIFTYVLEGGLAVYMVGELSSRHRRLGSILGVIAATRLPVLAAGLLLVGLWEAFGHPSPLESLSLILVGLSFVGQMFDVAITSWFQVMQRQKALNIAGCLLPLARLIGVLCLWKIGRLSLPAILWLTLATQIANTAGFIAWAFVVERGRAASATPERDGFGELLRGFMKRGAHLTLMYALIAAQSRLDWILVSIFLSKEALANYALANKLVEVAMLLAAIWAKTSFPWVSHTGSGKAEMEPSLALLRRLFPIMGMVVAVVASFWAIPVLGLLYGSKYAHAELPIRIMAPLLGIFMANQYIFYTVLAGKLERRYIWVVGLATLLQFALNLWLLPVIGIAAAAIGMIAMGLALHVGQIVLLVRNGALQAPEVARQEMFLGVVTLSLGLLVFFHVGALAGSVVGLVLVAVLAWGIVLRKGDARTLGTWLQRRLPRPC